MKSKFQKVIELLLILICVGGFAYFIYYGANVQKEEKEIEQSEQAEPLTIKTAPKNTDGTLTIYDEDKEIFYQYNGEIDIRSSGWNGEEIEIVINLPSTKDSCFDEEGNLLP